MYGTCRGRPEILQNDFALETFDRDHKFNDSYVQNLIQSSRKKPLLRQCSAVVEP